MVTNIFLERFKNLQINSTWNLLIKTLNVERKEREKNQYQK
jgi:hypothetical protein